MRIFHLVFKKVISLVYEDMYFGDRVPLSYPFTKLQVKKREGFKNVGFST